MTNIWDFIRAKLKEGQQLIFMVVIENTGSSPGRKGFKMVVAEDGQLKGSIGGGIMEYRLVEQAKKLFSKPFKPFIKRQDHHAENTEDSSGMICSGSQVVAFYKLDTQHIPMAEALASETNGQLIYDAAGIRFQQTNKVEDAYTDIADDQRWTFSEHHGYRHFLYLFGAGHVSVAVSRLFRQLGFYVTVFDNRHEEPDTFKNNKFTHARQIIDYKQAAEHIPEGDHVYVAIMTFAHKNDSDVLEQLIHKKVKYLGMMGSESKVDSVFKHLESKGISQQLLNRVDAPIGIQIHSQTPDEIAVSIAAKVIQVKNG